jgi:hypothetical protein
MNGWKGWWNQKTAKALANYGDITIYCNSCRSSSLC